MNWTKKTLAEIADFRLGKMLDQRKNKGEHFPYLANVNVRWGNFNFDDLRMMRFEKDELDKYGLKNGDLVMCEGGEPGRCAIWKIEDSNIKIQKALHRIRVKSNINNYFLFYFFLWKGRSGNLESYFTGATIKHLPKQQLARVVIHLPPLPTQKKIASILSAYDDLIENNRKRIRLLEEAAQNIYREWFVHFRFPGHEDVPINEETGLPEGWEIVTMTDLMEVSGGGTPSTKVKEYWENGNIKWFSPTDLSKSDSIVLLDSSRKISTEGLKKSSAKLLPPKTILMSSRATIGLFGMIRQPCSTNQGFINITPKNDSHRYYILFNLVSRKVELESHASGATFKELSKRNFKKLSIIQPSADSIYSYNILVESFFDQIENLNVQNLKLQEARDILLPRLMNQTIEVD